MIEEVPLGTAGQTDGYTTDAVNAITGALDSTQAIIRYRAATALGWIGPPARTAVNALIKRIDDRYSWEIRKSVCFALGIEVAVRVGQSEHLAIGLRESIGVAQPQRVAERQ